MALKKPKMVVQDKEEAPTKTPIIEDSTHLISIMMRDNFFHDPFFAHWWPTYENIHEKLMKDSLHFWSKVKEHREVNGRSVLPHFKMLGEPHNPPVMIFPRQWMFPRFLSKEDSNELFPLDFLHLKQGNDHIFYTMDDSSQLGLSMDIHDYQLNEVEVHVMGNVLTVDAKHQEDTYLRHFSRTHSLPKGCKAKMVMASMSSDGILVITALKGKAYTDGFNKAKAK